MIQDEIVFSSGDEAAAGMLFTGGSRKVAKAAGKKPAAKKGVKRQRGESVLGLQKKQKTNVAPLTRKVDVDTLFARYKPEQVSDLVTSKDRNDKVLKWMQAAVTENRVRSETLFLHGPSGSGKRTLVEYAARSVGAGIRRWINTDTNYHLGEECPTTALDLFTRALIYDRRPSTELISNGSPHDTTVLVFEGLPWCPFPEYTKRLFAVLQQFTSELGPPFPSRGRELPVIFIFTTHNTHAIKYQLHKEYPDAFLGSDCIDRIEVHPVTVPRLKKRLTHVATKEHFSKQQAAALVERVMLFSAGDIRQAMHDLAFNMLQPSLPPKVKGVVEARQAIRVDDKSDEVANCTSLDIGHATARVLAAKRNTNGRLEHSLSETLRRVPVDAEKLVDYVHHTLPRYCQVADGINRMASVMRRMSEASIYGSLCKRDLAPAWASECFLSWSVDKHMNSSTPARATWEQCHPPPFIKPREAQIVLKKVLRPSLDPESSIFYPSEAVCLDLGPMLSRMVFKHTKRRYHNLPAPPAPGRPPVRPTPSPPSRLVPFSPSQSVTSSRPTPFVPSTRPRPFVPPSPTSSRPVPFNPNAPRPFNPSASQALNPRAPKPFIPSASQPPNPNAPKPFNPNAPRPFVPTPAAPIPGSFSMGVARPPLIRLTRDQVVHLGEILNYDSGSWLPKAQEGVRMMIACAWKKPRCMLDEKSLLDPRVLTDQHEEVVVATEDPTDPIEDF